jgi:hypothetical protein
MQLVALSAKQATLIVVQYFLPAISSMNIDVMWRILPSNEPHVDLPFRKWSVSYTKYAFSGHNYVSLFKIDAENECRQQYYVEQISKFLINHSDDIPPMPAITFQEITLSGRSFYG